MPADPTIELWTLYSIGVASTIFRFYARLRVGGLKNLRTEDAFMVIAIIFYTVQTTLAYSIGSVAHGMANNGMTDSQRSALLVSDPEYNMRVIGSKIQVAGWTTYSTLMCALKVSMLFFYIRLTDGLGQSYRIRIYIGFSLVLSSYLATLMAIFIGCRPFSHYWQVVPDPGNTCQAAISLPIVWTSFAANVATDVYLIAIPLPMLWRSSLKLLNKIASTIILGAGIFVLVCAILKSVFVLVDPVDGAEAAGSWGTRETFVGVLTTNLPFIFPVIRIWLTPLLRGMGLGTTKKSYQTPTGFRTIGGGGGGPGPSGRMRSKSWRAGRLNKGSANSLSHGLSLSGSEERIVGGSDVDMKVLTTPHGVPDRGPRGGGIVITRDVTQIRAEVEGDERTTINPGSGWKHDTRRIW